MSEQQSKAEARRELLRVIADEESETWSSDVVAAVDVFASACVAEALAPNAGHRDVLDVARTEIVQTWQERHRGAVDSDREWALNNLACDVLAAAQLAHEKVTAALRAEIARLTSAPQTVKLGDLRGIIETINEHCTCGGNGPGEGCPACEVYHGIRDMEVRR